MGTGTRSLLAAIIVCGFVGSAHAGPKDDITTKSKEAMESYDLMDYDAAKKLLTQALATAKKAKLEKDPVTAKVYLEIGISAFAAADQDGAKAAFKAAVAIDPKIQIDPAYKSPELTKLLDEARGGKAAVVDAGPVDDGGVDCASAKGLQHEILDTAKRNMAQPIEATVGSDIKPARVSVMYRPEGATEFTEVRLVASGCKYTGSIPATGMKGSLVHYYVAAYDGNNKVLASKGAAGSPNIMELTGNASAPKGGGDDEDPISGKKPGPKKVVASTDGGDNGGEVHGGTDPVPGPKKPHVFLAVAGGTGFGYVTGKTEGNNEVQNCCIGSSLVVITPEIGFFVNRKTTISVAARLGLPIGANVMDHATLAPSALLRLRYAFSESGDGLHVMGQAGAGVLRNTIKLDNPDPGMDTDIVAQGPLLVGAGLGYTKRLGGSVSFMVDLSAIAGLAVVDKLGTAILNSGVSADLSIGLNFGF